MPQIPIYQSRTTIEPVTFPRADPRAASLPFEAQGNVARAQIEAEGLKEQTSRHYIDLANKLNDLFEVNDTSERVADAQIELSKAYDAIQQTPQWTNDPRGMQKEAESKFKDIVNSKLNGVFHPKKREQLQSRLDALYGHFAINLNRDARNKEVEWARAGLTSNLNKIHDAAVNASDPALFDNMLGEAKQLITEHLASGSIGPEDAVRLYNGLSKGAAQDYATADILRDSVGSMERARSGQGPYAHLDVAKRAVIEDHARKRLNTELREVDRLAREQEKENNQQQIQWTVDYLGRLYNGNWSDALRHTLEPDFFKQMNISDPETREKVIRAVDSRATNARQLDEQIEKERVRKTNMDLASSFIRGSLTEERVQASDLPAGDVMKWSNALERRGTTVQKEETKRAVNQTVANILDDKVKDETDLLPVLQEYGVEAWNKVTKVFEDRFKLTTGGWWAMADKMFAEKFKGIENFSEERASFASMLNDAVKTGGLKGDQVIRAAKTILDEQENTLAAGQWNSFINSITFGWGGERRTFADLWAEQSEFKRMRDRMQGKFIRRKIINLGD